MPGASGRFEMTQTISATFARWMASKFEPRPDKRIATRTDSPASFDPRSESRRRRVVNDFPGSLDHVADEKELLPDLREVAGDDVDLVRRDDHDHADAHVEHAQHLVALDPALVEQEFENRHH